MATNTSAQYSSDIEAVIAEETLPLLQNYLVAYKFGDVLTLPKGRGNTLTMTRFERLPLPYAPLSEGVPPVGNNLTISQVTVQTQQWGGLVLLTDLAELYTKHPVMVEAKKCVAMQSGETLERNTVNTFQAFTQVNYVNSRGARGSLVAGDVMNPYEINRAWVQLFNLGVNFFNGSEKDDVELDAKSSAGKMTKTPASSPHLIAICHPFIEGDLRQNSSFVQASSYSDLNKLYSTEFGQWNGIKFISSNMVNSWTGIAAISGTAGTAGALATQTDYIIIVTKSDIQKQYESIIAQTSAEISVTGPTGSISVVLPADAGYTYNVYVGRTATGVANLGLSVAGPTQGPYQGQATQLAGGQTVVITNIGIPQSPPAAPATGVTVYPTYVFGKGSFAQVKLDDIKMTLLTTADKADPLNQLREIGWKVSYGTMIKNVNFALRVESTSAFTAAFG